MFFIMFCLVQHSMSSIRSWWPLEVSPSSSILCFYAHILFRCPRGTVLHQPTAPKRSHKTSPNSKQEKWSRGGRAKPHPLPATQKKQSKLLPPLRIRILLDWVFWFLGPKSLATKWNSCSLSTLGLSSTGSEQQHSSFSVHPYYRL